MTVWALGELSTICLSGKQPNWDASDFPFKEDYTILFKPRAVIYRDMDENRKMMKINKVHKFSDGTLTRIKEKLDFMVKDFKLFKFNKGMGDWIGLNTQEIILLQPWCGEAVAATLVVVVAAVVGWLGVTMVTRLIWWCGDDGVDEMM
ncbi:hypothetical protein Tco_0431198 [Tanacetum coccineum]